MRVLITAGNTREKIDEVRDWGNIFTGNTGFFMAKEIAQIADVDLLTSNAAHLEESKSIARIHASGFKSHADLKIALEGLISRHKYDAIFMTAAVADYQPTKAFAVIERKPLDDGTETWIVKDVQAGKIKSSHEQIAILGKQTEKIVDMFRRDWKFEGLLIKFKLEVGVSKNELIRIGQLSRKASDANYLVANTLDMVSGANAGAFLLSDAGEEWVPRGDLAQRMRTLIQNL